jgi:hypothetical protein
MPKKPSELFTVSCPCCQAELQIDPVTRAVISHKEQEEPRSVSDLEAAVTRFKGEADRREDAFQKSVSEHRQHHQVLDRKFDELLKQARENPDTPPPKRDIDWD